MKINIQIVLTLTLLAFSFAKTGSLKENTQANLLRRSKVASNSTSTAAATGVNHKIQGEKNTFPNPTGNSVSKADLKEVKQVPKIPLSAALKELPYNEKVKRQVFLDTLKYTYYKMTKAEANLMFNIIDTDKDDLIDLKEYHEFATLYIMPFESCDTGKDHLLSLKDFQTCFAKDPKRQQITFRRRHEDKKEVEELIMNLISTRGKPVMNIFDYVIFRRALYAWTKCTSSAKVMSKSAFKCAITTFISNKYLGKTDTDTIFTTGISYGQGANLIDLDFISYLRVSYYTLAFVTFNESNPNSKLEKLKFIKSIQGDSFPNNFNENEVQMMYALTNNAEVMNFPTFAFFFHFHRLFNKFSSRTPFKLTEKEYYAMMKDNEIPMLVRFNIDRSFVKFSQPEYLEASLALGKKRLDENKFHSFLQKQDGTVEGRASNDKKSAHANAVGTLNNTTARKYFFYMSSITVNDENVWDKESFYRAFMFSNLYNTILGLTDGQTKNRSFIENMIKGYETSTPAVATNQRANMELFKILPDEITVDMLLFLEIHNCQRKMGIKTFNDDEIVDEVNMKIMLQDFGMELIPDTVLDQGFKGKDNVGRRIYKAVESFKNLVIVQGVAAEKKRSTRDIKVNKLVKNGDASRKFPEGGRRLEKSPLV
jgi:hypothetical protein